MSFQKLFCISKSARHKFERLLGIVHSIGVTEGEIAFHTQEKVDQVFRIEALPSFHIPKPERSPTPPA